MAINKPSTSVNYWWELFCSEGNLKNEQHLKKKSPVFNQYIDLDSIAEFIEVEPEWSSPNQTALNGKFQAYRLLKYDLMTVIAQSDMDKKDNPTVNPSVPPTSPTRLWKS